MFRFLRLLLAAALIGLSAPALADARGDSMAAYARANAALIEGRPRVARIELLNAIKADPTNGAAHLMQGLAYIRLGDGPSAEAEITRARETGFPAGATRHLMAEALLLEGAPQRALDEAGAYDVVPRYRGSAARMRGRARLQLGDRAGAGEEFNLAQSLNPRDPQVWTDIGRFRATGGDAAGALAAAERAVAFGPRSVEALVLRGELVRTQYGLVAALPWFDRALALAPDNVAALLEKAATLGDLGRMRDMLATTRAVIALDDGNPVAFYLQAVMAARAGNFTLARSLMRHTGGALEDVAGAMLLSAAIDFQTDNNEQAIDRLSRLIAMQPDNVKARRLLAAAQWRAGDLPGAEETLRDVADQPTADSYTLTLLGRVLERRGDRDGAAVYLDRAALPQPDGSAAGPGSPQAIDDLRGALIADPGDGDTRGALIRALIRAGRIDEAQDEAAAGLKTNPGSPTPLVLAGDVAAAQHRWDQAADAYRRAANISFTEPVALRMIDALRHGGRAQAAYQVLALYLGQNPRSVPALLIAADIAMAGGDWGRAAAVLEGLRRRLGNRDAAILNNLAWAYHQLDRPDEALPLAAAAHDLTPANPAVADTYGWLLLSARRSSPRGLALVEQAAAQAPGNAGVRWHLAQAYAEVGRREDARVEVQAALALPAMPERAKAEALLARL